VRAKQQLRIWQQFVLLVLFTACNKALRMGSAGDAQQPAPPASAFQGASSSATVAAGPAPAVGSTDCCSGLVDAARVVLEGSDGGIVSPSSCIKQLQRQSDEPVRKSWAPFRSPEPARLWLSDDTSCAASGPSGDVFCWGCYDGANDCLNARPTAIRQFAGAVAIASGGAEICALYRSKAVRCYEKFSWRRGREPTYTRKTRELPGAIASLQGRGGMICVLSKVGKVLCWTGMSNANDPTALIRALPAARAISVAGNRGCALDASDAVWCWSVAEQASFTAAARVSGLPSLASISVGRVGCGMTVAGDVWCWDYDHGQRRGPRFDGRPTQIAVGEQEACAVLDSGQVACWDPAAQTLNLRVLNGPERAVAVVGSMHFCAAESSGAIWCWGNDRYGQLGLGNRRHAGAAPGLVVAPEADEP
jgi:hypothetical protein